MSDTDRQPILPAHIEETVRAIAQLHAKHHDEATPLQRFTANLTAKAGHPSFIVVLTALVAGWIAFNFLLEAMGHQPIEQPPFFWLQGLIGLSALFMTVLILSTQRRDDELASHREQLTLELAILGDQKAAKIIQLLQELRRDDPNLRDRTDREADAMSAPADPEAVLNAIKDRNTEAMKSGTPDRTVNGSRCSSMKGGSRSARKRRRSSVG